MLSLRHWVNFHPHLRPPIARLYCSAFEDLMAIVKQTEGLRILKRNDLQF